MPALLLLTLALAANTLIPQDPASLDAQAITIYAPDSWCSSTLDLEFFGPNELNGWFCKDYFRAVIATGHGLILHPVQGLNTWTDGNYDVMAFFDEEVRTSMLEFQFNGVCHRSNAIFLACYQMFGACNYVDGGVFEDVSLCRETCRSINGCMGENCDETTPLFDSTNLTHCVASAALVESSASTFAVSLFLSLIL